MKKIWLLFILLSVAALMAFVLVSRKAEVDRKANATHTSVISVEIMTVQRKDLESTFKKVGTIETSNEVKIIAQISGTITAVYANVGTYLPAGAPLFKVDDERQQANLLSAQASYEKAKKDWERAVALHNEQVISDTELESARLGMRSAEATYTSSRREFRNSVITTPISGVVTDRPINMGATVNSGTEVATVVDNGTFKVKVNVGEQEAFKLKTGDPVSIETDVYPSIKLVGHIRSISAQSDSAYTFPVEITLMNTKEHPLKSGIFGKVTFTLGTENNVLTIPREALIGSMKNPQVYVVEGGRARLRKIVIGSEVDTDLVVLDGIKENDQVITSGQNNIKNNDAVKVL